MRGPARSHFVGDSDSYTGGLWSCVCLNPSTQLYKNSERRRQTPKTESHPNEQQHILCKQQRWHIHAPRGSSSTRTPVQPRACSSTSCTSCTGYYRCRVHMLSVTLRKRFLYHDDGVRLSPLQSISRLFATQIHSTIVVRLRTNRCTNVCSVTIVLVLRFLEPPPLYMFCNKYQR